MTDSQPHSTSKNGIHGLGNLSLLIFIAILLSLFTFIQFNVGPNGTLTDSARTTYGANKENLLGVVTSHFIHRDSNHLVNNIAVAILLLFFVFILESKDSSFKELGLFWWIILPVGISDLFLVAFNAYATTIIPSFNPYSVGLSLFDTYLLGFLMIIGWKRLIAVLVNGFTEYLNVCKTRTLGKIKVQHFLFSCIFLLLILISFSIVWTIFATLTSGSSLDRLWTEYAHFIGFISGGLVGGYWTKKNPKSNLL
ncbi:MAG: hypothetical protein V1861_06930 [Candidatus Micrarchaeota archaeon]